MVFTFELSPKIVQLAICSKLLLCADWRGTGLLEPPADRLFQLDAKTRSRALIAEAQQNCAKHKQDMRLMREVYAEVSLNTCLRLV